MYAWESIQMALDYIELHIDSRITIEQLSKEAHLSPFYLQRLFHRLTNKTIQEYIKQRRLAKAVYALKNKDTTILDIALHCGFQTHGNFTKVFKETFGITPSVYQKEKPSLDLMYPLDLRLRMSTLNLDECYVTNDIILEIHEDYLAEDKRYIGNSVQAPISEIGEPKVNTLSDLWNNFPNDVEEGMDMLTPGLTEETFTYFVGYPSNEAKHMEERIMPKGNYIVCRYEAENFTKLVSETLYKASSYLFDHWLPQHQITPEAILVQKYFHPFKDDSYIECWVKVKGSL